jgi:UDP-N-acetylmuramoylalanine--D-glutamate ligase
MRGERSIRDLKSGLPGKRVVIVGMGQTGMAAAEFLTRQGAAVTVSEIKTEGELGNSPRQLRSWGVEVEMGGHSPETLVGGEMIVLSPGVDPTIPPLVRARAQGIPVVSEVELASWYLDPPMIAVTGTNGKSTTTALIGHILSGWGKRVFVGGNIGTPLTEYLLRGHEADYVVAEVSSFQLEGTASFNPWIALLLNLGEDHLDRHPTPSAYAATKARIFRNQGSKEWAIVNTDDPVVRSLTPRIKAHLFPFGRTRNGEQGVWLEGRETVVCHGPWSEERFSLEHAKLRGMHNYENIMAAIGTAVICGAPRHVIQESVDAFAGLEHRLEWVGAWNGVSVYNDSKATNVASAWRALTSLDEPIILLAGGRDKGGDYSLLKDPLAERVRALILMGEAKEKMYHAFQDLLPCHLVARMEEGVRLAWGMARPGDTILLSPACSSYDMFADYRERGRTFKEIVRKLAEEKG